MESKTQRRRFPGDTGGGPHESLAGAIARVGSPVDLLKSSTIRPYVFPVAAEVTNWRSEQASWRVGCALLDQSHHMTSLYLEGSGALKLLRDLGVNSFANFGVNMAKQYIAVNPDGYLIGDAILFHLEPERFVLVGHPMVHDWIQFHLETGDYDAISERDDNSVERRGRPRVYRYELQGPSALDVLGKAIGSQVPATRFFGMADVAIGGKRVRTLRHGMAGQPGAELFGPWEEREEVLDALLTAGQDSGLVRVGAKAYSTANLESGWVPAPLPAIYADDLRSNRYREWLHASAMGSLGGSMDSPHITDYYVTPYDLGYGRSVAFDHDFLGREPLEAMAAQPRRTKVTLVWDSDDVSRAVASLYQPGPGAKYIDMPKARYALHQSDKVLHDGRWVGISMDCGYLANERAMVSLATIDAEHGETGTAVTVLWGEEPNSSKPQVEPHRQCEIRATVAPAPYGDFARGKYRAT
ncbi:MAG: aminomethyl transferase family protein [Acidimicrobiales bacterium]